MLKVKEEIKELPATLYGVYMHVIDLTQNDLYSIENTLRRYRTQFTYISYLLVVSNTDSKYCVRRNIMNGDKRGRPRNVVLGKKIGVHIHLSVMGDEENSAYKYLEKIKKAFNRRFKKNACSYWAKGKRAHAINFINYSLKQQNYIRKQGVFNEILDNEKDIYSNYL